MGYSYYDTPDGEDCDKKLVFMLKKATALGLILSSSYVTLVDQPKTYTQTLSRLAWITIPVLAAAAAGTLTVCILTNVRNKDDSVNHYFGALVAGGIGGVTGGNVGHGLFAGAVLGFAAMLVKGAQLHNYKLNQPNNRIKVYDHWTVNYDYIGQKKIPPEWVAKEDE